MYAYLLIVLFVIGIGLYFFAPVEEMYIRAKDAVEQNEIMQIRAGDMYETMKSKTGEVIENVEKLNTKMLEEAEAILPEVNNADTVLPEETEEE